MYAGTAGAGVFKSTDGGSTWNAANNGINTCSLYDQGCVLLGVTTLAIDPSTTPSTVYAGSDYYGVFKSTDGGQSWNSVNIVVSGVSIHTTSISALTVAPTTPSTLYVGTAIGVYESRDGGVTWTAGLSGQSGIVIAVNPLTPTTVYAGATGSSSGSSIYESTDGGGTWNAVSTNLPAGAFGSGVYEGNMVIDPVTPTTLYATLIPVGGGALGVYKSTDGGVTWNAINNGLAGAVWSVALDPASPSTLYAGDVYGKLFKTTDGGTTWIAAASPNGQYVSAFAFVANAGGPSTVFVAGNNQGGGVF